MQTFFEILWSVVALAAGGAIGFAFGKIQESAWRRYQKQEDNGQFKSGWAVMPGSGRRVAYLLAALAGIQVICPLLFNNGCQWLVSAGLVGGYGIVLGRQLRTRIALNK